MIEVLSLHYTNECTRKCSNCYMGDKTRPSRDFEFFLPFASIAKTLGIKQITLGGGEPSLFPKFVSKFSNLCRNNDIILNMTTNGDGFTQDTVKFFTDLTLVSFSIDKYKIHNMEDLRSLFEKMCIAREAGLMVGANIQLDSFIIDHLYDMLGELFQFCDRIYLLQPKPNRFHYNSNFKKKLQTARLLFTHVYVDESLSMRLGLSEACGRGRKIISVNYAGGVSRCSFDKDFAILDKPQDLIQVVQKNYPFSKTTQCPFI